MTQDDISRHLRLYETTALFRKENFSANHIERFSISTGSRLVFTLYVAAIDPGAQVNIEIRNSFSLDVPFDSVLQLQASATGYKKKVITDLHNLIEIEATVTGGQATFALGVTILDNALANRIDIENAEIDVDLDHQANQYGEFDSIRVGDGVELLAINQDGSINVNIVSSSDIPEIVRNIYNEALSVPAGTETNVAIYTVPPGKTAKLMRVEFTGDQIGLFRVYKNAGKEAARRTHHGSGLSGEFGFLGASEEGLPLIAGDVIRLTALHNRTGSGTFEGRIQVLELG